MEDTGEKAQYPNEQQDKRDSTSTNVVNTTEANNATQPSNPSEPNNEVVTISWLHWSTLPLSKSNILRILEQKKISFHMDSSSKSWSISCMNEIFGVF